MTFRIAAPYPGIQTNSYLPNPSMSDIRRRKNQVEERRSINGTYRTYLRSSAAYQFDYTFTMSREKALELRAFIIAYYRATWIITDHNGASWRVALTNNPWQFIADRAAGDLIEIVGIPLSFEGTGII